MKIAQVLVILEIEQIIGFSSYSDFGLLGYFYDGVMGGSLDDGKGEIGVDEASLELIWAHLDNHFLHLIDLTW